LAAVLASGEASAAVPAHLVTSTLKLVTAATAGRPAAGTSATAASAFAGRIARSRGLIGLAKAGTVVTYPDVGIDLVAVGVGVLATRNRPAAGPVAVVDPAPPPDPVVPDRSTRVARDEPSRPDEERLQGRWIIMEAEQAGEPLNLVLGDRLVIE